MLIVRPEPGASATAHAATAAGMTALLCPLFEVAPVEWTAPDPAQFDAVLLTSANAARHGGGGLARYHALPAYCVGAKTAAAATKAGFSLVHTHGPNVAAILPYIATQKHQSVLHLCGKDTRPLPPTMLHVSRIPIYESRAIPADPAALITPDVGILVHSPRAGARLNQLIPQNKRGHAHIIAISDTAAQACGGGWRSARHASSPDDTAMLALAFQMWQ